MVRSLCGLMLSEAMLCLLSELLSGAVGAVQVDYHMMFMN